MENSASALTIGGKSIGLQAKDYKVDDVLRLVVHGYGGISTYFDEMILSSNDRLIEVTVNSVKTVKKQEFVDA